MPDLFIYLFEADNFILWYYKYITTFKVSINVITDQNLLCFTHLLSFKLFLIF